MADNIIVDAGSIVGLIDRRDQYHSWCKIKAANLKYPFYICESVLFECFHLLEPVSKGTSSLLGFLQRDLIQVKFSYQEYANVVNEIIAKYSDLPASFADACLVAMYEIMRTPRVFTVFSIFRNADNQPLSLISPHK